ncbi:succinate dehydrogenase, cytochrome b556 subunit [Kaarinaea lacus]
MNNSNKRPVYLNLLEIHFPVTAVVSIAHRISGVLLCLLLPVLLYLFALSIKNEQGFLQVTLLLDHPVMKLLAIAVAWALAHHLFAGVRFLLLDIDVGITKSTARNSAWMVHIAAAAVTAVLAGVMI